MAQSKKSQEKNGAKSGFASGLMSELNCIAREGYLIGLDTAHSLIEENKRLLDAQLDQYNRMQEEYTGNIKSAADALPAEYSRLALGGGLGKILDMQKSYFSLIKKSSDSYTKELLDLNQRSAERAFSALERFVSALT